MPITPANGIDICYDTFGDPADPPLLLVMGFTAQMTAWHPGFCQRLADGGRYVIRFDNRDVGLSTHFDGVAVDIAAVLGAVAGHGPMPEVPYTLTDMGADAFGLLSALGIERAHIAGASMGGMIVQQMAIDHPERVLSMTSIMSTTGEPEFFQAKPEATAALMGVPPTDREAFIPFAVERARIIQSPVHFDAERAAQLAGESFDRAFYPDGSARQLAAIRASADRSAGLRALRVPTLVIHGRADPLVLPIGGERTAELIAGANLLMLHDMAHDLPEPLWPVICDAILSHTAHAAALVS
jgi:pimeloyl-ACP methyl ester carboxylesterase